MNENENVTVKRKSYNIYVNDEFVNFVTCSFHQDEKTFKEELIQSEFCKGNQKFIDAVCRQLTNGKWAGIKVDIKESKGGKLLYRSSKL